MEASTTIGQLTVEHRPEHGKSANRKLKAAGRIPGICYGKGVAPVAVSLDPKELVRALDPEKRTNTLIKMKLGSAGKTEELTVMLRDWQTDILRGHVVHADFIRVNLDQDVHAVVPILLVGKPEGVKLGGTLHQVVREIEIACTPDKIPVKIEINVDALNMGDALHVRDLKLPPGVKTLLDGGTTVCTITIPKAEKVAEVVAVEGAVEGAAAAPADGKAPAGGKAAAGKDAPAAKEGGDMKKKD